MSFLIKPSLFKLAFYKVLPKPMCIQKRMRQQQMQIEKEETTTKTNTAYATIQTIETGKSYSDQTGAFLKTSSKGTKYVFVFYHYDSNSIHVQPLKNKTAQEIT